jgi:hypothetical protein
MSVLPWRTDADEPVHRRAHRRRVARGRGGRQDRRGLSAARGHRYDLPPLARKYGGLQVSEAKRLKALEEENRQLKRLVADQALNLQVVKDLLGKKW